MRRGRPDRTAGTRSWVDTVVRSGVGSAEQVRAQVLDVLRADHPELDAEAVAGVWIAASDEAWRAAASEWPEVTDYDRLQQVFGSLEAQGLVVLQGCADHWAARDALVERDPRPRGAAWFTVPDIWHAVEHGMLEVNLWHGSTANAGPDDALLGEVLSAFAVGGLQARFEEGRIEVTVHWQRRPGVR